MYIDVAKSTPAMILKYIRCETYFFGLLNKFPQTSFTLFFGNFRKSME